MEKRLRNVSEESGKGIFGRKKRKVSPRSDEQIWGGNRGGVA